MLKVTHLLLVTAFLVSMAFGAQESAARAVPPDQQSAEATARLKQRILEIPAGTMVEVKLLNRQKVRGRLGQIDDRGFSLTTAQQGKIVSQTTAFSEVNSFKKIEGGKAGHRVLWMLAGVGVLVVICAVIAATQL